MKLLAFLFLSLLTANSSINAQQDSPIKVLSATVFKDSTQSGKVQLVDVRTAKEHSAGSISGSINIDYYEQDSFKTKFNKLDKSKPVYLYCRSGGRSHKAALMLEKMGFTKIYDLKGGYLGWK